MDEFLNQRSGLEITAKTNRCCRYLPLVKGFHVILKNKMVIRKGHPQPGRYITVLIYILFENEIFF